MQSLALELEVVVRERLQVPCPGYLGVTDEADCQDAAVRLPHAVL